jgi:hypothetical protein
VLVARALTKTRRQGALVVGRLGEWEGALPSRFRAAFGRKEGARGEVSDGAGAPYGDPSVR